MIFKSNEALNCQGTDTVSESLLCVGCCVSDVESRFRNEFEPCRFSMQICVLLARFRTDDDFPPHAVESQGIISGDSVCRFIHV
jgi:hypothetical protein